MQLLTNDLARRLLRWLDPLFALTLTAALAMAALTAWPGSARAADTTTEVRPMGDFEAVLTQGPMVQLRQGAATSLAVTARPELLAQLETSVEDTRMGKTLVVRWKRGTRDGGPGGHDVPVVAVVAPRITGLKVSGSGDILADGLTAGALSARVDGSGDIRLTGVVTDALALAVAGSGDIRAAGRAGKLAASVAGSGDIRAEGLAADAVEVSIAGSGDVQVRADRTLQVSIAGSGDVVYAGNPTVRQTILGSGSVTRR